MTETWMGRAACLLLALVWFVSMGVADANAYSYMPLLAGLAVVILLAISAMIRGAKVVQLSRTAWVSLGIGGYFLIRCLCSPSVVESWQEASTILGCGVFYVAGVYAAQGRSFRPILWLLITAGVLNLIYYGLMHYPDVPMEWAGRPAVGPGSVNHRPVTLFVYKNHAAAFLCMVGMLLFAAALWIKTCSGIQKLGLCALALLCVLFSAECHSRSQYFMIPITVLGGWVLWVVIKLYEDDRLGVGTIFSGFAILSGLGFLAGSVLLDSDVLRFVQSINSNSRFGIWQDCCNLLPGTPLWGNGALSVQWLIMARTDLHTNFFGMANFAHNEYLQVWVDYGLIGLGCMIFIIVAHVSRGIAAIAADSVSSRRRILSALSSLCIIGWGLCSFVDFFWHHFAIAGVTAFPAGITASPYPYTNVRKNIHRKVTVQSVRGKGVLALIGTLTIGCALWLVNCTLPAWEKQWEFNRLSVPGADDNGDRRHALLTDLVPLYPATELMDRYFRIPRQRDNWEIEAKLLHTTLSANPRQTFTAVMLAELLSRHGQYEKAELVYRRHYAGDGADYNGQADWANNYALNLLRRGQYLMATGEQQKALSLILYALRIVEHQSKHWSANIVYRGERDLWKTKGQYMPEWERYLKARKQDAEVLRLLKVQPDNSWQAPLEPGGKPALYRRYGAPESLEKAESDVPASAAAEKE